MVNGFNIYGFIHNTNLDKKITTLAKKKKKKELKGDKIVHLQAFSSSYFVFQPIYIYFKKIGNRVKPPDTSDNGLAPSLTYMVLDQEQNLMDNV